MLQQKTTMMLLVQVASNIGDHRWWYSIVDDAAVDDADADVGGDYYSDDYDDDYKDNSSVE